MPKRILVTGGAGYVGCVLVPELLARGFEVRVFDNMLFGDVGLAPVRDRIEVIVGDILEPPADLMKGIDAVIHLGGISSQAKASNRSPRYTDLMNHISTESLGCMAKRMGVGRFILASSCSIYATHQLTPEAEAPQYSESDVVDMQNPYGLSKRAAEEALFEMVDDDFKVIALRKGTLYGFSPKMRYDLVLNSFTKNAFTAGVITVHAGGELWRPMVDIRDVVEAYIAAIDLPSERVGNGIFNVLYDNQKLKDLALAFQSVIKDASGKDIAIDFKPFQVTLSYRAVAGKFQEAFGLRPKRSMREAVLEMWRALEAGHDHENPRYYNDPWYGRLFEDGTIRAGRRCT